MAKIFQKRTIVWWPIADVSASIVQIYFILCVKVKIINFVAPLIYECNTLGQVPKKSIVKYYSFLNCAKWSINSILNRDEWVVCYILYPMYSTVYIGQWSIAKVDYGVFSSQPVWVFDGHDFKKVNHCTHLYGSSLATSDYGNSSGQRISGSPLHK